MKITTLPTVLPLHSKTLYKNSTLLLFYCHFMFIYVHSRLLPKYIVIGGVIHFGFIGYNDESSKTETSCIHVKDGALSYAENDSLPQHTLSISPRSRKEGNTNSEVYKRERERERDVLVSLERLFQQCIISLNESFLCPKRHYGPHIINSFS